MDFLQEVYLKNNELDDIYIGKFNQEPLMYKKNKMELLVEIGEMANETKCFKYWSNKEANRELVLEEYADCIIMTLCLFNYHHLSLDNTSFKKMDDAIDTIAYIYKLASEFYFNDDSNLLKEILFNLVNLACLLNITNEEIISSSLAKINKNILRLRGED